MIDRRGLEHRLALARLGISPSDAAKARVLEGLPVARAASAVRASVFTAPRVALLMGISLAVGYGLGLQGAGGRDERSVPSGRGAAQIGTSVPLALPASAPEAAPAPLAQAPAAAAAPQKNRSVASEAAPRAEARSRRSASRVDAPSDQAVQHEPAQRQAGRGRATRARHDELALLRRVERALRAKEAALALALLDELELRHPRSALLEERTAARIIAECLLPGDVARPNAEHFLTEHRGTVYADRVRRACALGATLEREGSRERGH